MTTLHPLRRAALALALTCSFSSLVAFAGEPVETTDVEISANGTTEKLSIENLRVGETRQLYSEAGTLVTATRTADTLELDIAGDKTSIRMFDPSHAGDLAWVEAGVDGSAAGKRIVRVHADADVAVIGDDADHATHKVVVLKAGKDGAGTLHGDDVDVIVSGAGETDVDAKRVIVKRRIVREGEATGAGK